MRPQQRPVINIKRSCKVVSAGVIQSSADGISAVWTQGRGNARKVYPSTISNHIQRQVFGGHFAGGGTGAIIPDPNPAWRFAIFNKIQPDALLLRAQDGSGIHTMNF